MQVLWSAGRPLSRSEIMEAAVYSPAEPLFAPTSFHVIINDLLDKDYIVAVDGTGRGRKNARRFAPTVTRNEHLALQISHTENYQAADIPDIVCALLKYTDNVDAEEVLNGIEELIHKKRK